jgi:4-hydroxy-tetrahydrodipicolinate reductase
MNKMRVVVIGAAGRMGRAIVRLAASDPAFQVAAAVGLSGDATLGEDAGVLAGVGNLGVPVRETCDVPIDLAIDFSSPTGLAASAKWCAAKRVGLVSGTTGLDEADKAVLREAARATAVLWAPNMSVGVNVLLMLVNDAAAALGAGWDCEIVEVHHNRKADAPSGTAKALLESVCAARGVAPDSVVRHGREGVIGSRPAGEIGMHALRMGGVVGDHDVHFSTAGEIVTLRHHAESRDVFAAGALRAARWLAGRPAGLYTMRDVLAVARS